MKSRSEQEVTVVYDAERAVWLCWTDMPAVARRWKRLGWDLLVAGMAGGEPRAWRAEVPQRAVAFRKPLAATKSEAQKAALDRARTARAEGRIGPKAL